MSRIGKMEIKIPEGVTVSEAGGIVTVQGAKGSLNFQLVPQIGVEIKENILTTKVLNETKGVSALWGMTRAILANMIQGVTDGFEKKLELVGVGYRVKSEGKDIELSLGYSHPVKFEAPEGIELTVEDNKTIFVKGIDKHLVGQTAAKIRSLRKPEPYKGKGVRYADEQIKIKPGKAGKV